MLEIDTCGSSNLTSPQTVTFVHVFDACSGSTLLAFNDDGASSSEVFLARFSIRVEIPLAAGRRS